MKKSLRQYVILAALMLYSLSSMGAYMYDFGQKTEEGVDIHYNYKDRTLGLVVAIGAEGTKNGQKVTIPSVVEHNGVKYKVFRIGEGAFRGEFFSEVVVSDGIQEVGRFAFEGCPNLRRVVLPDSLPLLDHAAFRRCGKLTWVNIPSKCTFLGEQLFAGCSSLTSIEIPGTIKTVMESAFSGCSSLNSVVVEEGVEEIQTLAFLNCTSLYSISLPSTLVRLSIDVFDRCSELTEITVNENNPVFDSRGNCNAIIDKSSDMLMYGGNKTVIPQSVKAVASRAFDGRKNIERIVIPTGCTRINSFAFHGAANLREIVIPATVSYIGEGAFMGTANLTDITIPNSVTELGAKAFSFSGLCKVYVPGSITKIQSETFRHCENLELVVFGEGLDSIQGKDLFYECPKLRSVDFPASLKAMLAKGICGGSNKALEKLIFRGTLLPTVTDQSFGLYMGRNAKGVQSGGQTTLYFKTGARTHNLRVWQFYFRCQSLDVLPQRALQYKGPAKAKTTDSTRSSKVTAAPAVDNFIALEKVIDGFKTYCENYDDAAFGNILKASGYKGPATYANEASRSSETAWYKNCTLKSDVAAPQTFGAGTTCIVSIYETVGGGGPQLLVAVFNTNAASFLKEKMAGMNVSVEETEGTGFTYSSKAELLHNPASKSWTLRFTL